MDRPLSFLSHTNCSLGTPPVLEVLITVAAGGFSLEPLMAPLPEVTSRAAGAPTPEPVDSTFSISLEGVARGVVLESVMLAAGFVLEDVKVAVEADGLVLVIEAGCVDPVLDAVSAIYQ